MRISLAGRPAALLLLLTACAPDGPTFRDVKGVTVKHVRSGGLEQKAFSTRELAQVSECLYTTQPIAEGDAAKELLPTTYLVEVTDRKGIRSFELYTATNLKGNGGYYENRCLHGLIEKSGERRRAD